MARKKHDSDTEDTAALAVEAARLEAKKSLDDDSGAVESAALSDVALTDADVTAVGGPPVSPLTDADIVEEAPAFEPKPAWVSAAKALHDGKSPDANAAWHDFFKEPLPTTPPSPQWTGPAGTYSYYVGGRVLAALPGGFFVVMKTTPLEKPTPPVRAARR